MKKLQEEPHAVVEEVEAFFGPNIYTWDELHFCLGFLFSPEERQMIREAAMKYWKNNNAGLNTATAEAKFPLAHPQWNNNSMDDRWQMDDFKSMIIEGIRIACHKARTYPRYLI